MKKFKPGDKVRVVRGHPLLQKTEYVVRSDDDYVWLAGLPEGEGWDRNRFELILGAIPAVAASLPEDDSARGQFPMAEGLVDYFPNALAEVSRISYAGSLKHNVGQPMHWARGKSIDHRNKIIRHTVDSNLSGEAGIEHAAQAAWRALAFLQEKIEGERGAPMSRGSKAAECPVEAAIMPELKGTDNG